MTAPDLCSQMPAWAAAGPQQAMTSDVNQLQADVSASDLQAVESDGQQIASDAPVAAGSPPPIDPAEYMAAMSYYAQSGHDLGRATSPMPARYSGSAARTSAR